MNALQELYHRINDGRGWPGGPLTPAQGNNPLTHDILDRLGVLKRDHNGMKDGFEEDVHILQERVMSHHRSFNSMQSDDSSVVDYSPTRASFDMSRPHPPSFHTNPFGSVMPPTPPQQSPYQEQSQHMSRPPSFHSSIPTTPLSELAQQFPQKVETWPSQSMPFQQPEPSFPDFTAAMAAELHQSTGIAPYQQDQQQLLLGTSDPTFGSFIDPHVFDQGGSTAMDYMSMGPVLRY